MLVYKKRQLELQEFLSTKKFDTLFVHSDSFKTLKYVKVSTDKKTLLSRHIEVLESLVRPGGLILPTFNYQFPSCKVYDADKSISQVGHISEFYRTEKAQWRTNDPMFSVAGTRHRSIQNKLEINSFDNESIFSELVKCNAYILFYGASLSSATIIHHAEYLSNVKYRYWKKFHGKIIHNGKQSNITLNSHFRPMGMHLDYDWNKIITDLCNEGILHKLNSTIMAVDANKLVRFWCEKLSKFRKRIKKKQ